MTRIGWRSGAGYDRTHCDECRPGLFDTGTLLIEFVDARTSQLVWRGWAKSSVDGVIDDQEWMERKMTMRSPESCSG